MKCPICKTLVARQQVEFPFCSERCKLSDLAKWSSEEYRISSPLNPDDLEQLPLEQLADLDLTSLESDEVDLSHWQPRSGSKPN
jgi:uncharacterized protein